MFQYKKDIPNLFYAGGIIYNQDNKTLLLLFRDGDTLIEPYKWALWGGGRENNEQPHDCFIREFKEESGVKLRKEEIELLCEYFVESENMYRYTFVVKKAINPHQIRLGEGCGFATIPTNKLDQDIFCPRSYNDIALFLKTIKK